MTENEVLCERLEKIAELAGRRVRIDRAENDFAKANHDLGVYRKLVWGVLANLHRVAVCGDTGPRLRAHVASEVFGVGSTVAAKLCEEFGFDPDESIGGFDE